MALPSQTRREQVKKSARSRRLSRAFRLLLAALAGTVVLLVGVRMFAWPQHGGVPPAGDVAARPAAVEQVEQKPLAAAVAQAPVAPPIPAASAPEVLMEPSLVADTTSQAPTGPLAGTAGLEGTQPAAAPMAPPDSPIARRVQEAMAIMETNRPIEARLALSGVLQQELGPADEEIVRDALTALSRRLVFSPEVVSGDPFSKVYNVARGDALSTIVKTQKLLVDWRFIQRINHTSPSLREGQRLKLISGPFSAVVDKSDFRLDLYMGSGPDRVYVTSFPVGLGEYGRTPEGRFRVRPGSRLVDPEWINPNTHQKFGSGDPANPIGKRWIGLEGMEEANRSMDGYGIHGTIDPASIGQQKSMGCIRMLPDDVALVYEVLMDDCAVEIRP